jgi:hypothetical protein
MMVTVLCEQRRETVAAQVEGQDLWVPLADLERVSGWALKPEGVCSGDICVPIPAGKQSEFVRPGAFNLAALWRHLGRPVLYDQAQEGWLLGEDLEGPRAQLAAVEAPDFALPDLQGRVHTLSEHRGKKVFLISWASW